MINQIGKHFYQTQCVLRTYHCFFRPGSALKTIRLPFTTIFYSMQHLRLTMEQSRFSNKSLICLNSHSHRRESSSYGLKYGFVFFAVASIIASKKASNQPKKDSATNSQPVTLSVLNGSEWMEECLHKYPELQWLADSQPQNGDGRRNEFKSVLASLQSLRLIWKGGAAAYMMFIENQKNLQNLKLSRESFNQLHAQLLRVVEQHGGRGISEEQMLKTIEASIILERMGKSDEARKRFLSVGVTAADPYAFYRQAMLILPQHPELCPTFATHARSVQQQLPRVARTIDIDLDQIAKGDSAMFSQLKKNLQHRPDLVKMDLELRLIVHLLHICGREIYTQQKHSLMQKTIESITNT